LSKKWEFNTPLKHLIMKTNQKGSTLIVILIAIVILTGGYFAYKSYSNKVSTYGCAGGPDQKIGTQYITGKFLIVDEKCNAEVDGMPVYAFVDKCNEAKQYENKTVTIEADIYQNQSAPGLQCVGVNHINKIYSIKIIEAPQQSGENVIPVQQTTEPPAEFKQYAIAKSSTDTVNAANQFAFELYGQYKNTNDNVFFSPYSISSALEMTYEGARGKTAGEMQSVFHFNTDPNIRISSFAKLYSEINPKNASYQLSTANALWAQKSYPFNVDYLKTIETYYGGKATNLDFIADTEGSRKTINSWVSSKTNDKIPELFAPGTLDQSTRMVLTNAVYFKGKWSDPFDKYGTQQKDFTTAAGTKTSASTMHKQSNFEYAENINYQAISLPYENNDLSMVILLPKTGKMAETEKNLSLAEFSKINKSLNSELVDVSLPKFKFDTSYDMNDTLSSMGMPTAFDASNADFSGMDGTKNLYIGIVIHKAYVNVDEEGTEAAAATGVGMKAASVIPTETVQPKIFNADHPFIFAIMHNQSGSILFMGKVNDPTK